MNQFTDAIFKWIFSADGMKVILPTVGIIIIAVIAKIIFDRFLHKVDNAVDEHLIKKDVCPKCGGKLVKRHGKYGDFIGCSNFPKCRYTHDEKKEVKS